MLRGMATRKPAAKKRARPASSADDRTAAPRPRGKPASADTTERRPAEPGRRAPRKTPAKKRASAAGRRKAGQAAPPPAAEPVEPKRLTGSARERRFNLLVQTACLKAGTAAAINTISATVPVLGRLAPVVLGSVGETLVLEKIRQQLVHDIIELYHVELSDAEEQGVVLLATAVNIGAQQISKTDVEALIEQLSGRLYRPLVARVLPLASVATEVAAAVASTYAVGKRAQALCRLPGTGARDLSDLLRSLSGIDQAKLYSWTADAVAVALKPFRGVLMQMLPGLVGLGRGNRR